MTCQLFANFQLNVLYITMDLLIKTITKDLLKIYLMQLRHKSYPRTVYGYVIKFYSRYAANGKE